MENDLRSSRGELLRPGEHRSSLPRRIPVQRLGCQRFDRRKRPVELGSLCSRQISRGRSASDWTFVAHHPISDAPLIKTLLFLTPCPPHFPSPSLLSCCCPSRFPILSVQPSPPFLATPSARHFTSLYSDIHEHLVLTFALVQVQGQTAAQLQPDDDGCCCCGLNAPLA